MSILTRNLTQDVTHWPVTGSDGYGGFTFGSPSLLRGRWEFKAELFINLDNEEVVSRAVVYLNAAIEPGDYLAEGDQTSILSPLSAVGSDRIRNCGRTTDLRALNTLWKAWL